MRFLNGLDRTGDSVSTSPVRSDRSVPNSIRTLSGLALAAVVAMGGCDPKSPSSESGSVSSVAAASSENLSALKAPQYQTLADPTVLERDKDLTDDQRLMQAHYLGLRGSRGHDAYLWYSLVQENTEGKVDPSDYRSFGVHASLLGKGVTFYMGQGPGNPGVYENLDSGETRDLPDSLKVMIETMDWPNYMSLETKQLLIERSAEFNKAQQELVAKGEEYYILYSHLANHIDNACASRATRKECQEVAPRLSLNMSLDELKPLCTYEMAFRDVNDTTSTSGYFYKGDSWYELSVVDGRTHVVKADINSLSEVPSGKNAWIDTHCNSYSELTK